MDSGLECESPIEEVVGGMSFVLHGLYLKSMLPGGELLCRWDSDDEGGTRPRQGD